MSEKSAGSADVEADTSSRGASTSMNPAEIRRAALCPLIFPVIGLSEATRKILGQGGGGQPRQDKRLARH